MIDPDVDWKVKYDTLKAQQDRIKEDAQYILETFGARKKSDGSFDIDFDKFIKMLGAEQSFKVRDMIEAEYGESQKSAENA